MTSAREYCARQPGALLICCRSYQSVWLPWRTRNMDCYYQANQRIRPPSFFNSPPILYGYSVPTYYSPPFFPLGRNSEVHRPPVTSVSPQLIVPNTTTSESSTSPVSTVSQTPPESPSESSTETHENLTELHDEPEQSRKDASESEDKTGETSIKHLFVKKTVAHIHIYKLN